MMILSVDHVICGMCVTSGHDFTVPLPKYYEAPMRKKVFEIQIGNRET